MLLLLFLYLVNKLCLSGDDVESIQPTVKYNAACPASEPKEAIRLPDGTHASNRTRRTDGELSDDK